MCSTVMIKYLDKSSCQQGWEDFDYSINDTYQKFQSNKELNPIQYYKSVIEDEKICPNMRLYFERFIFESYIPIVHKFYFEDLYYKTKQRISTLDLAFTYFIQASVRLKWLEKRDLVFLIISWVLLASKLDEIDDYLLSYPIVLNCLMKSKNKIKDIGKKDTS